MDFLGLSDEFLKESKCYCNYDKNIPFQYRMITKLLSDNDYENVKRLIEANPTEFENNYNYLLLDLAIERCIDIVIDENGLRHPPNQLIKGHRYMPTLYSNSVKNKEIKELYTNWEILY